MNYVVLEPGEANVPHIHTISEDTIFILEGEGTIRDYTNNIELPFHAGCAVHVPVGIKHAVAADRGREDRQRRRSLSGRRAVAQGGRGAGPLDATAPE